MRTPFVSNVHFSFLLAGLGLVNDNSVEATAEVQVLNVGAKQPLPFHFLWPLCEL